MKYVTNNKSVYSYKESKALSFCFIVPLAFLAISFGIAVPILSRSFYYIHIDMLKLTESTPWSYEQIKTAFDEMMDFIWKGTAFSTGELKWSKSGMQHFADCKVLFWLDAKVLIICALALVLLCVLCKVKHIRPARFFGFGVTFWAGIFVFALFALIAVLGAIDFDRAFVIFHQIFFPGKTNWLFDEREDEIIRILPQEYFRDCAVLAIAIIVLVCVIYIIAGRRKKYKF